MTTLNTKLNPSRFPGMSTKMAAFVGYILNQEFTKPQLLDLSITSDGYLTDPIGGFLGDASDLERNWRNLLDCAGLTSKEKSEAHRLYYVRIKDWRI